MSSQSRNSRKATQAAHIAFAAALLAAGSAAQAADQSRTFELTAFSNTASGYALVHGNYDLALRQLDIDARSFDNVTAVTNRCVAFVVTRKFKEAHEACDSAVRAAKTQITTLPVSMSWARQDFREYLALAYSNRAVLNWASNDAAAAQADLKKAEAVAPKAEFVARNLTALQTHAAVAQIAVAPKS
jgi:tetratricopeptide (TPR) repeat protein